MRCCATCRGHRSLHWHRSRFPANGAAPRGGRRFSIMGLARQDGFAGDAVNPSMEAWPRHPCRGHPRKPIPPGHGQFPCASTTEKKKRSKAQADRFALHPRMAWIYRVDQGRHLPTAAGKLSGVGRCGAAGPLAPWARGMPRAGWAGGPTPVLPCAQDSAHEQGAIEPPGTGLRRVLQPHTAPPNPQQPRTALALASAGAGLQALQYNYVTQPAITSRARIASHSSSIRHTRLIASRRSGSRCHTGNNPASV
ncbi:hypothetical protein SAMN02744786_3004 [Stenotrophomonas sp. CC120222-04]|nr:hypothetical protein SAMN02744786_3004 [Stenotrophomonas sp. CC120222-04]